MPDQLSNSQFGFWKKWFWIGIVVAITSVIGGLVYGIALVLEKNRRGAGLTIIIFAIIWFIFATYFISPWLVNAGILPHTLIMK